LRAYDLVVIYRPATEDVVLEQEIDKVSSLVKTSGGEMIEINRWGKKPLGYEIRAERTGIYVIFKFRSESSVLSEIDRELGLNENVLRQRVLLSKSVPQEAPAPDEEAGKGVEALDEEPDSEDE
jgi:small subunit ribosomal protein S6